MRTGIATTLFAIAAVALALAIAACGEDESAPATTASTPQTAVRERFNDLVTTILADRQLDAATIECALGELASAVSDDEINAAADEIRETGVPPPGVIEAATAAGEACGGD